MRKLVVDTNCFMVDNFDWFLENKDDYEYILTNVVLQELDHLKIDRDRGHKARKGINFIKDNLDLFTWYETEFDINKCDDAILEVCQTLDCELLTLDTVMQIKAEFYGVKYIVPEITKCEYKGYKIVQLNNEELANWYEGNKYNKWGLVINEYLVIKNKDDEIIDKYKWTNEGFKQVKYKNIENKYVGKVKPRNLQQELAFDMLQDEDIKIKLVCGTFGSGKDFLEFSDALQKLEKGKIEKIIYIRNAVGVKNAKDIGFLPGTANEKMMPYVALIGDIIGGDYGIDYLMSNGRLEIQPLQYVRGRSFNNCIIYCTEAENLTKEHIQLIISRLGENAYLYANGDYKQADAKIFEMNSGIEILKQKLKGNENFGYVEFEKTERSKVADLAKLLD